MSSLINYKIIDLIPPIDTVKIKYFVKETIDEIQLVLYLPCNYRTLDLDYFYIASEHKVLGTYMTADSGYRPIGYLHRVYHLSKTKTTPEKDLQWLRKEMTAVNRYFEHLSLFSWSE